MKFGFDLALTRHHTLTEHIIKHLFVIVVGRITSVAGRIYISFHPKSLFLSYATAFGCSHSFLMRGAAHKLWNQIISIIFYVIVYVVKNSVIWLNRTFPDGLVQELVAYVVVIGTFIFVMVWTNLIGNPFLLSFEKYLSFLPNGFLDVKFVDKLWNNLSLFVIEDTWFFFDCLKVLLLLLLVVWDGFGLASGWRAHMFYGLLVIHHRFLHLSQLFKV